MWNLNPASHCTPSAISRNFEQSAERELSPSPAAAAQSCTKVAQRPISNRLARLVGRACTWDNLSGSCVYFVEAEGLRRIKIGFSATFPTKRISGIQTGCPARLIPLAVVWGTRDLEKLLHESFRTEHVRGEWFRLSRRLAAFIDLIQVRNLLVTGERFVTYPIRSRHVTYCRNIEFQHRIATVELGDYEWRFAVRSGYRRRYREYQPSDEQAEKLAASEAQ